MSKKAVLRFSFLEKEYQKEFGVMPDYHFERLAKEVGFDNAGFTVRTNMDKIWKRCKEQHANSVNPNWEKATVNPFSD